MRGLQFLRFIMDERFDNSVRQRIIPIYVEALENGWVEFRRDLMSQTLHSELTDAKGERVALYNLIACNSFGDSLAYICEFYFGEEPTEEEKQLVINLAKFKYLGVQNEIF